ncbi:MAG: sigma factor [Desulfitobacteriaceae bacterium]
MPIILMQFKKAKRSIALQFITSQEENMQFKNTLDLSDIELFHETKDSSKRQIIFERIINRHHRLLTSESRRFYIPGYDFDDMIQETMLVAYEVINKDYIAELKTPFWYFLRICIRRQFYSLISVSKRNKNIAFTNAKRIENVFYDNDYNEVSYIIPRLESHENRVIDHLIAASLIKELQEISTDLEFKSYYERNFNNLTYQEISNKYGFHYKKIDNAICRVSKKISKIAKKLELSSFT